MVNSFHEAVLVLRCYLWAEWVPSAANIADYPSRPDTSSRPAPPRSGSTWSCPTWRPSLA